MASVLSYSMSDPFVPPPGHKEDPSGRYSAPPLQPAPTQMASTTQQSRASTTSTRASTSSSRQHSSRPSASQAIVDEFGTYMHHPSGASASTSSRPHRASHAPTMPLPLPTAEPIASMSAAQASSHSHSAAAAAEAKERKRQSHNPSAVMQSSPPKQEYLSDEYVLHPSVHAYKLAHPHRPMIALGQYILLQTLGEGEFGKVKLGVHSDYGVEVAIKLIRRGALDDETRANKVEREIEVLRQLKHPNIVRMLDVIDTAKYIGIVLEFAGGGELFDYILANRYLKEKDASRLFAQLISGVDYLHQKHIVHRDLKLENLLLDKHRNIIITDFGFANRFERDEDDLMATSCGSPCYAAPELVVSEGLYVGSAVDVWSCGVILYAMLSGYLPYDDDPANPDGDNINLLYKYIMSTPLNFPEHMSKMAMDLLLIMLVPNPQDRCTIPNIEAHPWLGNYRDLFQRTVQDHEGLFTDNMVRKSHQAKRDLATRRKMQQEAKLVKALQRSQSTAPGSAGAATMFDQHRRGKDQRHRSALPGTSTMPDYLFNAGHHNGTYPARQQHPTATEMEPSLTAPAAPLPSAPVEPLAKAIRSPASSPKVQRSSSVRTAERKQATPEPPSTPTRLPQAPTSPMSANKNRHTIQVEYDADAAPWIPSSAGNTPLMPAASTVPSSPPTKALDVPQAGDMEIESSSEIDLTEPKIAPPAVVAPPVIQPKSSARTAGSASTDMPPPPVPPPRRAVGAVAPSTPTKRPRDDPESVEARERVMTTPKMAATTSPMATPRARAETTPRASAQLPPGAATPTKESVRTLPDVLQPLPVPQETRPIRPAQSSTPPKVTTPPKRPTRSRKGMSLDKFGLAKLLGQSEPVKPVRQTYVPSSQHRNQHNKSQSIAYQPQQRPQPVATDEEKKNRRRTLHLAPNSRTTTPDSMMRESAASITSGTSSNKAAQPVVGPQGIQPRPSQDHSSPSLVTVDAYNQEADEHSRNSASSSAAKRVMDWFRRKSLAKDTLTSIKTTSSRPGSVMMGRPSLAMNRTPPKTQSSGGFLDRPRESIDQRRASADRRRESVDLVAASDTSSVANPDSPFVIVVKEEATPPKQAPTIELSDTVNDGSPVKRVPLAPAHDIVNTKSALAPPRAGVPARSKSVRNPVLHNSQHANAGSVIALVSPETVADAGRYSSNLSAAEEAKLRVHTGLVDQSALSSRPPPEVMAEVIKVLHAMGMEVKQEATYRLRCTRVRRRKAGPTTGLSTIMGTTGGRTDSRGLPLPSTPSGGALTGLKGMLLRRGSSYSSHHSSALARSESDLLAASNSTTPGIASPVLGPTPEPLYGEHSIDNGDEVKFYVELCRIKNLHGLYLLSIKRVRGSVWSFKFIYQTVVERCETLTH